MDRTELNALKAIRRNCGSIRSPSYYSILRGNELGSAVSCPVKVEDERGIICASTKNRSITDCSTVCGLSLTRCEPKLTSIPEEIQKFPNLEFLSFGDHRGHQAIEKIEHISGLEKLEHLLLGQNKIKRIEGLRELPSLKSLDLSSNEIVKLENLKDLPNLEELKLSHNKIKKIENLDNLGNIKQLMLYGNDIKVVENVENLPDMSLFSLEMNPIESVRADRLPGGTRFRVDIS